MNTSEKVTQITQERVALRFINNYNVNNANEAIAKYIELNQCISTEIITLFIAYYEFINSTPDTIRNKSNK